MAKNINLKNAIAGTMVPAQLSGAVNWRAPITNFDDYDNYLLQNPFFKSNLFSVRLSIDFCCIVIPQERLNLNSVTYSLSRLGVAPHLFKINKGKSNIIIGNSTYQIYFRFVFVNSFYNCCILTLYRPDSLLITHIDNLFSGNYLISTTEFTADLSCGHHDALLFLMKHAMILKWPGRLLRINSPTVYAGNPRKTQSKALRLYEKAINCSQVVRMEIVWKRSFFRKNSALSLVSLSGLNADQVFKDVSFQVFKRDTVIDKFKKILISKYGEDVNSMAKEVGRFKAEFYAELQNGNTRAIEYLRHTLGNGDYLLEIPFNQFFREAIAGKAFI